MGKGNPKQHQPSHHDSSSNLKGTFIAVMLLGVFILVAWFGFYALFLSR
ncbi:MAG TPA: cytochrome c oxidase subunit 2A [Sporosarcina psychrophila]|uniref:Cytochrome c oxidase subunit 2A n=1 Tax=Sporosarcina psychrophila TaxID=1476 RepID=A0A921FZD4_SPOPS|nr:cytochrome c oxidase subunit 2A [Sporosarcina psychrophila]